MRWVLVFPLLAGIAASAHAQRNAIDIKVRLAGQAQWADELSVLGSASASVEVAVFFEHATGYGFATSVHGVIMNDWGALDQVTLLDRPDGALHPDGRQGRFNFGAQRQVAYTTGVDAGRLRISASGNTQDAIGGGIGVNQRDPVSSGSLFDAGNVVLGFRFDLRLTTPVPRTYTIATPLDHVLNFRIFETPESTSARSLNLGTVELDGAHVHFAVPSPGSASSLVLLVSFIPRRRGFRSCCEAAEFPPPH